jgi:hypothetical protein
MRKKETFLCYVLKKEQPEPQWNKQGVAQLWVMLLPGSFHHYPLDDIVSLVNFGRNF